MSPRRGEALDFELDDGGSSGRDVGAAIIVLLDKLLDAIRALDTHRTGARQLDIAVEELPWSYEGLLTSGGAGSVKARARFPKARMARSSMWSISEC